MTTFHNISFYGASQVLRFLQMEGMTLHQQKAQDLLSGDIWNGGLPGFVPPGLARHSNSARGDPGLLLSNSDVSGSGHSLFSSLQSTQSSFQ